MKITFVGMESSIELPEKGIADLRIGNERLFSRICASLLSLKGEKAIEPYSVWGDDGLEFNPKDAFLVVPNPLELPWHHKNLTGSLYSKLERELLYDEDTRQQLQELGILFEAAIHKLDFQFYADYSFGVQWNLGSYLKALSYGIDIPEAASLFDNLISFINFGADMAIDRVLVFINLKTFLTKNELIRLHEHAFFHGICILLLENQFSHKYADCELEYVIDRDFVEFVFNRQSVCPSSTQGRFCSNGFGAVTF